MHIHWSKNGVCIRESCHWSHQCGYNNSPLIYRWSYSGFWLLLLLCNNWLILYIHVYEPKFNFAHYTYLTYRAAASDVFTGVSLSLASTVPILLYSSSNGCWVLVSVYTMTVNKTRWLIRCMLLILCFLFAHLCMKLSCFVYLLLIYAPWSCQMHPWFKNNIH